MLALDEFVLWVNAESPYKTPADYVNALKAGNAGQYKMAGTGSKQEDQIITVALEKTVGKKMTYVPFKGGGDVAVQLVGKHVDSTVNNPIEAVAQWRGGKLRPLCVFDGKPIVGRLLSDGEPFLVLADFAAYARAQDEVDALYLRPDEWSRKAVLNALGMGTFSSDRSIREYAERIWRIKPVL